MNKMETYRKAYVYVEEQLAGVLRETEVGYSFQYCLDYLNHAEATPVSLTLPLNPNEYTSKILFPFFDGLIPEGWLLSIVTKNWKIDPNDRFGLLLAACKDSIGNVKIEEEQL